jgi:hypothetical protein
MFSQFGSSAMLLIDDRAMILALNNGPAFAAGSAVGVLGGLASLSVFCILYALSAEKTSWPLSSALALAGLIAAASIWRFASLPHASTIALKFAGGMWTKSPDRSGAGA